ncbi:MAG: methionyl-tRNA formyltransferase [Oscillospiraceae bacterium]|jgi:methionyl-tRNA formyltransferase|nr:methionyl-tRNA formyltransferase [Oscillospiraceae bacterium]
MRIVFMGTPAFAVASLERLAADGHEILAVICQPDKPVGRKKILTAPEVKTAALAIGLPIVQPASLRENAEVSAYLQRLSPDLIAVVAYGKLLPLEILDLPAYGCVNVHGSLLPKYRGAAPIQRAILNGETVTGVTTMLLNAGMDTGDMLMQREYRIPSDMTAGELFEVLAPIGADLLSETVTALQDGTLNPMPQDEAEATYAPMLSKADAPLDFSRPAQALHNQVRGLQPWPGAIAVLGGKNCKVIKTRIAADTTDGALVLPCGNGTFLEIGTIQPEGKAPMSGAAFKNGYLR